MREFTELETSEHAMADVFMVMLDVTTLTKAGKHKIEQIGKEVQHCSPQGLAEEKLMLYGAESGAP